MTRFRQALGLILILGLTACETAPKGPAPVDRIETQTVGFPVAVRCGRDPGSRPTYADTPEALRAAPDIFARVKLVLAARAQRMAREAELEAAGVGCW